MSWIEFSERATPPTQVTRHWVVGSKTGDFLGEVKWFNAWRRYAFTPSAVNSVVWFEQDCLREIAQFVEDQTQLHKDARKMARDLK